jgi:membrane protease YdiL (CAAX protease family)
VGTRLIGWSAFVLFLTLLAYASRFSAAKPEKDVAYRWGSSISALIEYGIIFSVILLLTRGLDRRSFLALRRPLSWSRAFGISLLVIFAVLVVSAVVGALGNAEKEQGLIPSHWNSHRIAQFAAFAAVVTIAAPVFEELLFRGAGYALLEPFGRNAAVLLVGLSFGLIHGLVIGFPVIATFGIGLAYLRARTESIYPCMILHASFNAIGLALGVAS